MEERRPIRSRFAAQNHSGSARLGLERLEDRSMLAASSLSILAAGTAVQGSLESRIGSTTAATHYDFAEVANAEVQAKRMNDADCEGARGLLEETSVSLKANFINSRADIDVRTDVFVADGTNIISQQPGVASEISETVRDESTSVMRSQLQDPTSGVDDSQNFTIDPMELPPRSATLPRQPLITTDPQDPLARISFEVSQREQLLNRTDFQDYEPMAANSSVWDSEVIDKLFAEYQNPNFV